MNTTEEGNFGIFDTLDYLELKSILKSNRFTKIERNLINKCYLPQRIISEFIPIVAICGITSYILEIVKNRSK